MAGAVAGVFAQQPALAGAFVKEPEVAGAVAGAFSREPELAGNIDRKPSLAAAVAGVFAREPEVAGTFAQKPELVGKIAAALARQTSLGSSLRDVLTASVADEPAFADKFPSKSEIAGVFARQPALAVTLANALARDPLFSEDIARHPALASVFVREPALAVAFALEPALAKELAGPLAREPALAGAFAREPKLAGELAGAFAREPVLAAAFSREHGLVGPLSGAFTRNPTLPNSLHCAFKLEATFPGILAGEFVSKPALATGFAQKRELACAFACAFARGPALASDFAGAPEKFARVFAAAIDGKFDCFQMPEPLLFGVDAENNCICRLYINTGRLFDVYRVAVGTRVHSILVLDAFDEQHLCAIESAHVSQQLDGLVRNETVYRLVRLSWHYANDNENKETWEKTWSAEFHRVNTENLGAMPPSTALCRAGSHVLCAVAHSNRLFVFDYRSSGEPLEAAGAQSFNEQIVHADALNSANKSLLAIAFTDDSIRLYRHLSTQANGTRLDLQQAFRVVFERVHKLLFAGKRLLVSEHSEDENVHRLWSFQVNGERLNPEGRVLLDSPTSVECLCFDGKYIYSWDTSSSIKMLKF